MRPSRGAAQGVSPAHMVAFWCFYWVGRDPEGRSASQCAAGREEFVKATWHAYAAQPMAACSLPVVSILVHLVVGTLLWGGVAHAMQAMAHGSVHCDPW